MKKYFLLFTIFLSLVSIQNLYAQELVEDTQEIIKAQVLEINSSRIEKIPGTDTNHTIQNLKVKILEGNSTGKIITLDNDFIDLKVGSTFYLKHIIPWEGGTELYSVSLPYRLPSLLYLGLIFVVLTIIFGGKQGIRGLLSLLGSFILIGFIFLPAVIHGYSPIATSICISSLIIILGSYITHGFTKTTTSAVIGMIVTISFIGLFAYYAIHFTQLTGFETDESIYLHFNTQGKIDLSGLLLGGILIGLLGVMYDAAIGQAVSVEELHRIAPHIARKEIYKRAIRIGREHIGALVNTLAIAYVGASLPLLLLFYASTESALVIINREVFSAEIVRTLIGSIGLILAVPITTLVSTMMLIKKQDKHIDDSLIQKETEAIEHHKHSH